MDFFDLLHAERLQKRKEIRPPGCLLVNFVRTSISNERMEGWNPRGRI